MSHHFIKFNNVSYSYADGSTALRGVSFRIEHSEKVALLGDNGAGKSTLLLLTDGLLQPTIGEIIIGGTTLTKKSIKGIRSKVGFVFQNPDDQLFMPTIEEDVAFGPQNMNLSEEEVSLRVTEALKRVGALHLRDKAPYNISGGEKRRAAIATALSTYPDILVMDEPTAGLDLPSRERVIELICRFDHTCLIATHDLSLARRTCHRSIVLREGQVVFDGATDNYLSLLAEQFDLT